MSTATDLIERYIATWNEPDPAKRRAAVDEIWTEDASYVDPVAVTDEQEATAATIGAVQQQFAGLGFRLAGPVDPHHDLVRFTWELGPEGADALVVGFDVAVLSEDGRLRNVHGFLDGVPTT